MGGKVGENTQVQSEIDEGAKLLESALRHQLVGPYQLQAAIAACHARAPSASETDWGAITGIYTQLEEQMPSSVVRLNRAVAAAMAGDPDIALAIIDELSDGGGLERYY